LHTSQKVVRGQSLHHEKLVEFARFLVYCQHILYDESTSILKVLWTMDAIVCEEIREQIAAFCKADRERSCARIGFIIFTIGSIGSIQTSAWTR
jgi:hypothetical protein